MNVIERSRNSEARWTLTLLLSGAMTLSPLFAVAQAQEANTNTPASTSATASVSPPATAATTEGAAKPTPPASPYSPGVGELLKLAEAKVSKEVMLKFVATSDLVVYPTAGELVAMKKQDVPDEVIVAFMDRGAALIKESRGIEQDRRIAVPSIVSALSTEGEMDPDSYEFWWYHYAYPRALSFSYKTLTPYLPTTYDTYSYYPRRYGGDRSFPYSSRYATSRPPLTSSRVEYGKLPANTGRHSGFAVPSATVTLRNQGGR
jgi:hypothetical protein